MSTDLQYTQAFSISDVERDTGLAKETLRVWERRYAFPQPQRDAYGERSYPFDQVQKLRMVKHLLDMGYRPGKIMQHSTGELQQMANGGASAPRATAPELTAYLAMCRSHRMGELGEAMRRSLAMLGLKKFTTDLVAPLTGLVGEAWACGDLAVYEEHLYSETLQTVMRHAIFSLPEASRASTRTPRILLTTLPHERHGLGLLMAEALCVAGGAHCQSLGVETPLADIAAAARGQHADIVALSFSSGSKERQARDSLQQLRDALPARVEIWAGGRSPVLYKRPPAFLQVLDLRDVEGTLADWRRRHQRETAAPH
ncbi:MerR family transcriptional regulator [Janthinobacterium aquaticum]|uniref:MerR family transcriptional regulator n=1 Tax=Janthinobacterium sp. FT58W TaxID=2654254 RepID=UPI0012649BF2|nr:MerR family transcriptional regulator [Janthinobacterium sp. FT58W]KAB8042968.1 MerR family transcriptional regulator [Janthinobacterium sp. FT58W]